VCVCCVVLCCVNLSLLEWIMCVCDTATECSLLCLKETWDHNSYGNQAYIPVTWFTSLSTCEPADSALVNLQTGLQVPTESLRWPLIISPSWKIINILHSSILSFQAWRTRFRHVCWSLKVARGRRSQRPAARDRPSLSLLSYAELVLYGSIFNS